MARRRKEYVGVGMLIGARFYPLSPRCRCTTGGGWHCRSHPHARISDGRAAKRHAGCALTWICGTHGLEQPWGPSRLAGTAPRPKARAA